MRKSKIARAAAMLLAGAMLLTACGNSSGTAPAAPANGGAQAPAPGVDENGKDSTGKVVDLTVYSQSLGKKWFTEEDEKIWENIEEESKNPDKVVIRYGSTSRNDLESAYGRAAKRVMIDLKKNLGDRVEIKRYYNGILGTTADQILGGLQAGNFEMYSYNVGAWYEYTKAFTPFDMGFLIPNLDAGIALTAYDNPVAKTMKARSIEECGLFPIVMPAIGMRHLTNNIRPINKIDDIKGLKIRVQSNNMHMTMFESLGCSPTPIAFAELFTALQQKTVDGEENPIGNIFEQNYAEVQKYLTLSNHLYTSGCVAISNEWFQSLPDDVREVLENAASAAQDQAGEDLKNCEGDMLEYLRTVMEVNELSDEEVALFRERAMTTWDLGKEVMGDEYYNTIIPLIEEELAKL